jgi:hypothetical protein
MVAHTRKNSMPFRYRLRAARGRIGGVFGSPLVSVCPSFVSTHGRLYRVQLMLNQAALCKPPVPLLMDVAVTPEMSLAALQVAMDTPRVPWVRVRWRLCVKNRPQLQGWRDILSWSRCLVRWGSRDVWVVPSDDDDIWCMDRGRYLRHAVKQAVDDCDALNVPSLSVSAESSRHVVGTKSWACAADVFLSRDRGHELWSMVVRSSAWVQLLSASYNSVPIADIHMVNKLTPKMQSVPPHIPGTGEFCWNYAYIRSRLHKDWVASPQTVSDGKWIAVVHGCSCHSDWGVLQDWGVTFSLHKSCAATSCSTCGRPGRVVWISDGIQEPPLLRVAFSGTRGCRDPRAALLADHFVQCAPPWDVIGCKGTLVDSVHWCHSMQRARNLVEDR